MYAVAMDKFENRVGVLSTATIASQEYNSTNTSADRIFPTVAHTYIMLQLAARLTCKHWISSGREVLRKDLQGSKGLLQVNLPSLSPACTWCSLRAKKCSAKSLYRTIGKSFFGKWRQFFVASAVASHSCTFCLACQPWCLGLNIIIRAV